MSFFEFNVSYSDEFLGPITRASINNNEIELVLDTGSSQVLVMSDHCKECKKHVRNKIKTEFFVTKPVRKISYGSVSAETQLKNFDISFNGHVFKSIPVNVVTKMKGTTCNILGIGPSSTFWKAIGCRSFVWDQKGVIRCFKSAQQSFGGTSFPILRSTMFWIPHALIQITFDDSSPTQQFSVDKIVIDSGTHDSFLNVPNMSVSKKSIKQFVFSNKTTTSPIFRGHVVQINSKIIKNIFPFETVFVLGFKHFSQFSWIFNETNIEIQS